MYYVLDRCWAMHPARIDDDSSYDRQGAWWDDSCISGCRTGLGTLSSQIPSEPGPEPQRASIGRIVYHPPPAKDLLAAPRRGGKLWDSGGLEGRSSPLAGLLSH